jgi:hypothetical protein
MQENNGTPAAPAEESVGQSLEDYLAAAAAWAWSTRPSRCRWVAVWP